MRRTALAGAPTAAAGGGGLGGHSPARRPPARLETRTLVKLIALLTATITLGWVASLIKREGGPIPAAPPPRTEYGLPVLTLPPHAHARRGQGQRGGDLGDAAASPDTDALHRATATAATAADAPSAAAFESRRCTDAESELQSSLFEAAKVRGCPASDDAFMRLAHAVMPHARTFVDIGSNKGYTAARFYELWSPQVGLNPRALHSALRRVAGSQPELVECGACNDCEDASGPLLPVVQRLCSVQAGKSLDPNTPLPRVVDELCAEMAKRFAPIRVYSFDGNPEMVSGVRSAVALLATSLGERKDQLAGVADVPRSRLPDRAHEALAKRWTVEHAAFSDEYREGLTVTFSLGEGEKGRMQTGDGGGDRKRSAAAPPRTTQVPVLTVDALVARERLDHVDVLKIDVEGHDPLVLRGARDTLGRGAVTLLLFEYNKLWDSASTSLEKVSAELERAGFACYLEGKNAMLKLTHGCWSSRLEMRRWSNVFCPNLRTPQGAALATVYDAYALAFAV